MDQEDSNIISETINIFPEAEAAFPLRAAVRKKFLDAVLVHVPFDGWSTKAMANAATDLQMTAVEIDTVFPGGTQDVMALWAVYLDHEWCLAYQAEPLAEMRIRQRIFRAVQLRLELYGQHRLAVKQALQFWAMPWHSWTAVQRLYRLVDLIWWEAGDQSTDFNFYSKRLLLAGVYSSTLIYWLSDDSDNHAKTWDFLERRIEQVMQIQKYKAKIKGMWPFSSAA